MGPGVQFVTQQGHLVVFPLGQDSGIVHLGTELLLSRSPTKQHPQSMTEEECIFHWFVWEVKEGFNKIVLGAWLACQGRMVSTPH